MNIQTTDIIRRTSRGILFLALPVLVFSLMAGCAPQQFKAVEQICLPDLEKTHAIAAAEEVLQRMHFAIEKSDIETGYVRTHPLPGAKFFEFWRSDSVGTFNWAEANLHSIRRIAELNIDRQNGQLCIGCEVKTQRLTLPQQNLAANSISSRITKGQYQRATWLELGSDSELGTEILKRIEKQLTNSRTGEKITL